MKKFVILATLVFFCLGTQFVFAETIMERNNLVGKVKDVLITEETYYPIPIKTHTIKLFFSKEGFLEKESRTNRWLTQEKRYNEKGDLVYEILSGMHASTSEIKYDYENNHYDFYLNGRIHGSGKLNNAGDKVEFESIRNSSGEYAKTVSQYDKKGHVKLRELIYYGKKSVSFKEIWKSDVKGRLLHSKHIDSSSDGRVFISHYRYQYDKNGLLIRSVENEFEKTYIYDAFDEHGNWISRTSYGSNGKILSNEIRTITYYN